MQNEDKGTGDGAPLHGDLVSHVLDLLGLHAFDHGFCVWKWKKEGEGQTTIFPSLDAASPASAALAAHQLTPALYLFFGTSRSAPVPFPPNPPVRMTAGASALTVMPVSAYSLPAALARPMTAALLVE